MADQRQSVGAIWIKEGKNGKKYMSMKLGDNWYVIFKNAFKKEDKHPDYRVFEQQERQEGANKPTGDDVPF